MKLTRLQAKALKVYWRYHTSSFTVGQVLRSCWRSWLLLAVCATVFFFFLSAEALPAACLLVGLCLGAFLRDIGHYQVAYRIWPVTQQIIDWKRVSEMIESHEKGTT